MEYKHFTMRLAVVVGAFLLLSCGGGEGEVAGIDRGGSRLSVTGPINGFGSVIINGVHYNTDNADIYVRGEPSDELQLDVGDYVTVVGLINSAGEGIAHEVHFQPKVTGRIESRDPLRNRVTVLGQVIQLEKDTNYGFSILPRNIEGLATGYTISVSGITDSDNVIHASRVERVSTVEAEVAGTITQHNTDLQVFYLNELRVEYAFAALPGALVEGQPVVVRGALAEGVFHASNVSFNTDYRKLSDIPNLEFRGYITPLSTGYFEIDGVPAQITPSTVFDGGDSQSLSANDQVRARGRLQDNVLQIEYLHFVSTPVMQAYGKIDAIDTVDPEPAYVGSVTVGGFTYKLRADTRLIGDWEQRITVADLRSDSSVYVSAFSEGENLVAASLAVDNRATDTMSFEFEGMPYDVEPEIGQFSILNRYRRIQTSTTTRFSEGDTCLSQEEFYQAIVGKSVRVRGYLEEGLLVAQIAQIGQNLSGDRSAPTYHDPDVPPCPEDIDAGTDTHPWDETVSVE